MKYTSQLYLRARQLRTLSNRIETIVEYGIHAEIANYSKACASPLVVTKAVAVECTEQ